jgi:hypothetical protein
MSKDSDKDKEWEQFTNYYVNYGLHANTYALNWDANNPTEIYKSKGKEMLGNLMEQTSSAFMAAKASGSKLGMAAAGFNALK